MPKDRACANDQPHPVSMFENNQVSGLALCGSNVFSDHMEEVEALRSRQAAYLDSLPDNECDAISEAWTLLHSDGEEYPEGFEEALHLSHALDALVKDGDLDTEGRTRDAALYISYRVTFALHRTAEQLDHISQILSKPARHKNSQRRP
ncbi:hypothetical protein [Pelagimonas varians]|uniref:Uncharacterized protein n=1 Tax=Pelagimonas varians TaxID=696760 RepID=A0A238K7B4_9RHOB|nr:hypothetical protein [Pelagimonas varians]PYG30363.1 hypothetical protein C8N36_10671 [Pelagimonas varians]SMX37846.1 hypothetical protein PEV8663_01219 [Pelagimonas varians]